MHSLRINGNRPVNQLSTNVWLGGRVVRTLDLRSTGRKFESWPLAIECNPGQVVNTHVPLSPSSIIWYQPAGGLAAGKVTVGLASHWPRVTDNSGITTYGLRPRRGR